MTVYDINHRTKQKPPLLLNRDTRGLVLRTSPLRFVEPNRSIIWDRCGLLKVEESTQKIREQKSPHLFAIIPFSSDMDDVYYLGIHETARALGCSCDKVDQIEFVGPILDKIYDSIKNSRIVLAELSTPNVNVYYELGYAHALGKPTILITKDISASPFDVRGYNHIVYSSIRDLRSKLKARLEAILTQVRGTTTK